VNLDHELRMTAAGQIAEKRCRAYAKTKCAMVVTLWMHKSVVHAAVSEEVQGSLRFAETSYSAASSLWVFFS
jgi:hypothetical protein